MCPIVMLKRHDLTTDYDARLGIVIHDPAAWDGRTNSMGLTLYASSVPSDAVRRTFSPDKRTYITQLEMLAAVTTYRAAPAFAQAGVNLARRNVNHWIDNTGTLSGTLDQRQRRGPPDTAPDRRQQEG